MPRKFIHTKEKGGAFNAKGLHEVAPPSNALKKRLGLTKTFASISGAAGGELEGKSRGGFHRKGEKDIGEAVFQKPVRKPNPPGPTRPAFHGKRGDVLPNDIQRRTNLAVSNLNHDAPIVSYMIENREDTNIFVRRVFSHELKGRRTYLHDNNLKRQVIVRDKNGRVKGRRTQNFESVPFPDSIISHDDIFKAFDIFLNLFVRPDRVTGASVFDYTAFNTVWRDFIDKGKFNYLSWNYGSLRKAIGKSKRYKPSQSSLGSSHGEITEGDDLAARNVNAKFLHGTRFCQEVSTPNSAAPSRMCPSCFCSMVPPGMGVTEIDNQLVKKKRTIGGLSSAYCFNKRVRGEDNYCGHAVCTGCLIIMLRKKLNIIIDRNDVQSMIATGEILVITCFVCRAISFESGHFLFGLDYFKFEYKHRKKIIVVGRSHPNDTLTPDVIADFNAVLIPEANLVERYSNNTLMLFDDPNAVLLLQGQALRIRTLELVELYTAFKYSMLAHNQRQADGRLANQLIDAADNGVVVNNRVIDLLALHAANPLPNGPIIAPVPGYNDVVLNPALGVNIPIVDAPPVVPVPVVPIQPVLAPEGLDPPDVVINIPVAPNIVVEPEAVVAVAVNPIRVRAERPVNNPAFAQRFAQVQQDNNAGIFAPILTPAVVPLPIDEEDGVYAYDAVGSGIPHPIQFVAGHEFVTTVIYMRPIDFLSILWRFYVCLMCIVVFIIFLKYHIFQGVAESYLFVYPVIHFLYLKHAFVVFFLFSLIMDLLLQTYFYMRIFDFTIRRLYHIDRWGADTPHTYINGLTNRLDWEKIKPLGYTSYFDNRMKLTIADAGYTHYMKVVIYKDVFTDVWLQRCGSVHAMETRRFVSGGSTCNYVKRNGVPYDLGVLDHTFTAVSQAIYSARVWDQITNPVGVKSAGIDKKIF